MLQVLVVLRSLAGAALIAACWALSCLFSPNWLSTEEGFLVRCLHVWFGFHVDFYIKENQFYSNWKARCVQPLHWSQSVPGAVQEDFTHLWMCHREQPRDRCVSSTGELNHSRSSKERLVFKGLFSVTCFCSMGVFSKEGRGWTLHPGRAGETLAHLSQTLLSLSSLSWWVSLFPGSSHTLNLLNIKNPLWVKSLVGLIPFNCELWCLCGYTALISAFLQEELWARRI